MHGARNGKSCKGEGGLLLLLLHAENKSDGHDQWRIWIAKLFRDGGTSFSGGKNIVLACVSLTRPVPTHWSRSGRNRY